jgi:ComF family protein
MLTDIVIEGLRFFFPVICPFCNRSEVEGSRGACPDCDRSLDWFEPPWCVRCGRPVDAGGSPEVLCGDCVAFPPVFDAGRAALTYAEPVQKAITKLKYGRDAKLAVALGDVLLHVVPEHLNPFAYDFITAVPLHPKRLRWRGFNQALLIAETLGRRFRVPLQREAIARVRETPAQAGLDRAARLANLSEAFHAPRPHRIAKKRVLLIDDVVTTGMTLSACAAALKVAGAERVDTLAVARSLPGRAP